MSHYLTALKGKGYCSDWEKESDIEYFKPNDRITLVKNSVLEGLTKDFDNCDSLYTDLAWEKGLPVFDTYANTRTIYREYQSAMAHIFNSSKVPSCFVGGKKIGRHLLFDYMIPIKLNGDKAIAYIKNFRPSIEWKDSTEIIEWMAQTYNHIGDPCCGLGRTGGIFFKHGKYATLADYNGRCISYLANNWSKIYGGK